ncbi:MAG: hypothetical protein CVT60_06215 [Actinobacteria bacterium HGW-Actinobacteria-10]|nr:MAG: hypothetical protein CVT60_06215 [Actinobacteria bacterium HGW-Actinobacteria-10]
MTRTARLTTALRSPLGRRAVAAWVSLALLVVLAVVWTAGSLVAGGAFGCDGCHAMAPYAAAHSQSMHQGTSCRQCHTREGIPAAVVAAPRSMRWISSAVMGRDPAPVEVNDDACRYCHRMVLTETVDSGGLRVRHSDFIETSCRVCHAGSAHVLDGRHYMGPQMEDCTGCHRTSAVRVESCDICHVGKGERAEQGASAWRAVHGGGWAEAHGMGDLDGCVDCHEPSYCARCHGLAMPHPVTWASDHGKSAVESMASCDSCHDPDWCSLCHGMDMPHPSGFIAAHPVVARAESLQVCYRCHSVGLCESCHVKSSHPIVPGVRTDAHGGGDR